jgi:diguanylate cyclase (GGDEF)-like protein
MAVKDETFLIEEAKVGRRQSRLAAYVAALLVVAGVIATPFANTPMLPIPGYMTAFGAAMVVVNVLLAALLFSKGAIERRGDAVRLGAAYFFVAIIFLPLIAAFPGGIMSGSLIGTPTSAVWLWSYWHAGFALAIIHYAWVANQPKPRASSVKASIVAILLIVSFLTLTATVWLPYMPEVFSNGQTFFSNNKLIIPAVVLATNVMALIAVARLRGRTPEQLWLTVGMLAACLDVWLTVFGANRFSLGWYFAKFTSLFTSLVVLMSHFHGITLLYNGVARANELLRALANQDGLTSLLNRRSFDETLSREWKRNRRDRQPISLLMIDVDFFKKFNDQYGHLRGDDCLRQVAAQLKTVVQRPADVAARYGGEEFAVILPATDIGGASKVADRILANMRALAMPHAKNPPHNIVSVSIGIATMVPDLVSAPSSLISKADDALYHAKAAGRDQAQIAPQGAVSDLSFVPG